jgi:iron complex outermembrane receptor protein
LNLSYNQGKWQFRGSAGRTIREPDFTERYNNYNKSLVTGGSVGNPWLVAESSFSYEVGADYFAGNNLKISLTGFERRQRDLVDWVATPYSEMPRKENLSPTGTFALAKNIARVNTAGLEMDIQYSKDLGSGQQVHSTVGLLWLDSQSGNGEPSFYLSSHANFMTNFNLMYSNNAFSVSVNGIYKNRNPQQAAGIGAKISSDYFVINAMASLFLAKKKLSLFAEVDNIFDVSYSDLLGSKMPGRWVMGGVRVRLGE